MKKFTTILLALSVFLSVIVIPQNAVLAETDTSIIYWDGSTSAPTADLDGDGYLDISTPAQLASLVKSGGSSAEGKYELVNDIWLNDMTVSIENGTPTVTKHSDGTVVAEADLASTYKAWYSYTTVAGEFEGNGFVVHGLFQNFYTEASNSKKTGLFPQAVAGLTIRNLGLEDTYITSNTSYKAGGLIGYVGVNGSIDSCYVGESVYIYGNELGGIIGGGTLDNTAVFKLTNSYSLATLKHLDDNPKDNNNTYIVNGLIGDNWKWSTGVIENCYAISDTGLNRQGAKTNCVQITSADIDSYKGIKAVEAFGDFSDKFVTTEDGFPTLKVFIKDYNEFSNFPLTGKYIEKGTGNETDPYIIETAGQLRYCVGSFGQSGKYYKLANDIYLNDPVKVSWSTGAPVEGYTPNVWFGGQTDTTNGTVYRGLDGTEAAFNGHIDGNGYTVYGIYGQPMAGYSVETSGRYFISGGLIPAVGTASVKNLSIKKSFIAGGRNTGAIVGYVGTKATLDTISVDDTVTVAGGNARTLNGDSSYSGPAIGGMIGYVAKTAILNNCGFSGSIYDQNNGVSHEWGLIGTHYYATLSISNSFSAGYAPLISSSSAVHATRNITVSNVYSNVAPTDWITESVGTVTGAVTVVDSVVGTDALSDTNMSALDKEIWYAVKDSVKAPLLRTYGSFIGDVDENGKGCETTDADALRTHLIGAADYKNTDKNRDSQTNICDLVAISQEMIVLNDDWRSHPEDFKLLAFTFDDGPDPYNASSVTAKVADIFAEYNGSATFFLIGQYLEQEGGAEIAKYALSKGSELASHSYSHQNAATMAELSEEEFTKEIDGNNELIKELTGYTPKFFRGGGYARNDRIYERLEKLNMPAVGYYVAFGGDHSGGDATVESIMNNVMSEELPDGAIIIGHSSNKNNVTVDALSVMLPELYKQGYRFCTMSELFEYKGVDYDNAPIHCYINRVETTEKGYPEVHTQWRTYLDSWRTHPEDYKLIAFTFDDGPNATKDGRMVDLFAKYHGTATFFVRGSALETVGYSTMQNAINNGWDVGNHSLNHKNAAKGGTDGAALTYDEIKYEIETMNALLEGKLFEADGVTPYTVNFYRPPEIATTPDVFTVCEENNMSIIWDTQNTYDWSSAYTYDMRYDNLRNGVGTWIDGDIVLGHVWSDDTYNILADLLDDYYDAGYRFCSLSELMKHRNISIDDISGELNNVNGNKGMVDNIVKAATYGKPE